MAEHPIVVAVARSGDGDAPWVLMWKAPRAFVFQQFDTREAAVAAARELALQSDAAFDVEGFGYPAKQLFISSDPFAQRVAVWAEQAEQLLWGTLDKGRS